MNKLARDIVKGGHPYGYNIFHTIKSARSSYESSTRVLTAVQDYDFWCRNNIKSYKAKSPVALLAATMDLIKYYEVRL